MSGLNPTRCRNKVTHPFYARWPGVRAPPETCRSWLQLAPAEIGERESRSSVSPSRALPLALAPVRPPLDNQPHSSHDTRISPPPARVLRRPPRRVVLPHTRCPHEPRALPLHNPLPLASTSRVPTPRLSLRLARPHFTRPLLRSQRTPLALRVVDRLQYAFTSARSAVSYLPLRALGALIASLAFGVNQALVTLTVSSSIATESFKAPRHSFR